jgi:hypothetical protein
MDRQQMERCLERVAAYRASGMKAKAWAEANDVEMRSLASWCAHSRRWQDRLDGISAGPSGSVGTAPRSSGFVAARVVSSAGAASVRVEVNAGAVRLELHGPAAHARELAVLLRELGR